MKCEQRMDRYPVSPTNYCIQVSGMPQAAHLNHKNILRKITHRYGIALLQSVVYGAEALIRSCARQLWRDAAGMRAGLARRARWNGSTDTSVIRQPRPSSTDQSDFMDAPSSRGDTTERRGDRDCVSLWLRFS